MRMNIVKSFFTYTKKYKKYVVLTSFFLFLESLVDGVSPYFLKKMIERSTSVLGMKSIFESFLLFLGILCVGLVASLLGSYISSKATSQFCYDIRKDILHSILKVRTMEGERIDVSTLTTVVSNDIETVGTIFLYFIRMFLKIPFLFLFSFLFMALINPFYFLFVFLTIPILVFILFFLLRKAFPYFKQEQDVMDQMTECIDENISGKQLIMTTMTENRQEARFEQINEKLRRLHIVSMKTITLSTPILKSFIYALTLFLLFLSHKGIFVNVENVGTLMAFLEYLTLVLSSLLMGGMLLLLASQSVVSFKRIQSYLNLKEEYVRKEKKKINCIRLENVSFSYHSNEEKVLDSITFSIKKGDKIAIVGPTGSGKSTLLKIIANVYEEEKGSIFWDNYRKKAGDRNEKILYQPDTMVLFKGTIEENISFYEEKASRTSIEVSDVCSIVKKKEKGIEEQINGLQNNYSGGEKNRISLARSLNRNPSFLCLDDSLSATDLKTEKKILKQMFITYNETAFLFVTSRLSSLEHFDKIIVLNHGKIEAMGTLEEVMRNPFFLYMYQISREVNHG